MNTKQLFEYMIEKLEFTAYDIAHRKSDEVLQRELTDILIRKITREDIRRLRRYANVWLGVRLIHSLDFSEYKDISDLAETLENIAEELADFYSVFNSNLSCEAIDRYMEAINDMQRYLVIEDRYSIDIYDLGREN